MRYFHHLSQIGPITITLSSDKITSVLFGKKQFHSNKGEVFLARLTKRICKQLDSYFAGKLKVFDLPLFYQGTPFQMKVWRYLQTIPYGKIVSYQEVAEAIGHPKSARAVGTACKRNPIPIIIPCHRVIKSNGEIGEYSGGKGQKQKLLGLERR